jgi:antitoxin (DNA-binding transcriptional repressor) of toxin-antitoxin stability system
MQDVSFLTLAAERQGILVGDNCHPVRYSVITMKTMTIRDFRTRPAQMRKELNRSGQAVLTTNGKPMALLLSVKEETLDDTLRAVNQARAQQTLQAVRKHARERGLDKLSMSDIDSIIAKTRKASRETAH